MILEITIGILGLIVVILGYTTFNLLRKNERAEDIIVQYNDYITEFNKQIALRIDLKKQMIEVYLKVMMKQVGFLNKLRIYKKVQIDSKSPNGKKKKEKK